MFLTGEFSKIARVSKRMLQYYDDIGLLRPAHTDPQTGYRYYSAKQLPHLNRILALKELGMTLQQIARMLEDDVSDAEIQGMLLMQKAELEKKLADDLERFRRIEARLQRQQTDVPDVVIKSIPPLTILSVPHLCVNTDDGFRFVAYLTQYLPLKVDSRSLGHMVALADMEDFIAENVDIEFGFFVEGSVPSSVTIAGEITLSTRTLPAVETMATIVHVGHPQSSSAAYSALGTWIENNHYRIAGQQREIFIELPRPGHGQEVVLEIQFPVEKIAPTHLLLTE
ncbi:MAG: MerR family transcriptional regulator [Anaerolineae bacterium]|nr:MerR family transcriptional regulator [Anaerolineae bacterium]